MTMKTQISKVDAASPPRCPDLVTRRGRRVYDYLFLNSPNRQPLSSPAIVHRLTRAGDESGLRV